MLALGTDIRFAVRSLAAAPRFSLLIVVVLALSAGINTGLYCVIYSALSRPLGVSHIGQLVFLYAVFEQRGREYFPLSSEDFRYFSSQSHLFSDVAAHSEWWPRMLGPNGVQVVHAEAVTANYFQVLGVTPSLGRAFIASDDDLARPDRAVIISHTLWTNVFGADRSVLGRTITVTHTGNQTFTIIGVGPPGFRGVSNPWEPTGIWVTYAGLIGADQQRLQIFSPIGRVRPEIAPAIAEAAIPSLGEEIARRMATTDRFKFVAFPAASVQTPFDPAAILVPTRVLIGLLVVALTVLVIATVNVTGIIMSRTVMRVREIATRTALGATTWRLAHQLLIESLGLALPAAVASVLVAWCFVVLVRAHAPARYALDVAIEPRSVVVAIALSTALAIVITIMPVLATRRVNVQSALGASGETATQNTRVRYRHGVVIPQIALTLGLLVLAGVYWRSILHVYMADVGYARRNVIVLSTEQRPTAQGRRPSSTELATRSHEYYRRITQRFDTVTDADSVALTTALPLDLAAEGHIAAHAGSNDQNVPVIRTAVSPQYFRAIGVPLLAGRTFLDADDLSSENVAIVSRSVAAQLFAGRECVGEQLTLTNRWPATGEKPLSLRIVGVVGDTRPILRDTVVNRHVYVHLGQQRVIVARMVVAHVDRGSTAAIRTLREAVTSADPTVDVIQARTLQQVVNDMLYVSRTAAGIVGVAAIVGLFFATVGLYSVLSYSVSQRVAEIGIRTAVGASSRDILRLIMKDGLVVLAIGIAAGLLLARGVLPVIGRYIDTPAAGLAVWIVVPLLLATVALLACYLPARRAARLDALAAIRYR